MSASQRARLNPPDDPDGSLSDLEPGILNEQVLLLVFERMKWDLPTLCSAARVNRKLRAVAKRILWRELCLFRAPRMVSALAAGLPGTRIAGGWPALAKLLFFCPGSPHLLGPGQGHVGPSHSDVGQAGTSHIGQGQVGLVPGHIGMGQAGTGHVGPNHVETGGNGSGQVGLVLGHNGPNHVEIGCAGTGHIGPKHVEEATGRDEPGQVVLVPGGHIGSGAGTGHNGPDQVRAGHNGSNNVETDYTGPDHAGTSHTGPGYIGTGHNGPTHVEAGSMGPGQMGSGQIGPGQVGLVSGHFVKESRFSKTSGRSFLARGCRGDLLYVSDPCEHALAGRVGDRDEDLGVYRGVFRGFMRSKTRAALIGRQVQLEERVRCPYCGARLWSMTAARMVPKSAARRLGTYDGGLEYFVCINGHLHGTCWLVPLSSDEENGDHHDDDEDEEDGDDDHDDDDRDGPSKVLNNGGELRRGDTSAGDDLYCCH